MTDAEAVLIALESVDRAGVPVTIGDVVIHPGDVVLGDDNGIVALRPDDVDPAVYERAQASNAAEPDLLQRITAGEPLEQLLALRSPSAPKGH
jgi:regulator of RNase E activity RraA